MSVKIIGVMIVGNFSTRQSKSDKCTSSDNHLSDNTIISWRSIVISHICPCTEILVYEMLSTANLILRRIVCTPIRPYPTPQSKFKRLGEEYISMYSWYLLIEF